MPWRGSPSSRPPDSIIDGLESGIFITKFRQKMFEFADRMGLHKGVGQVLSSATNIPQCRISDYAHGYRNIPSQHIAPLCQALECSPDEIMGVIDASELRAPVRVLKVRS